VLYMFILSVNFCGKNLTLCYRMSSMSKNFLMMHINMIFYVIFLITTRVDCRVNSLFSGLSICLHLSFNC
jgi:hypothetical protein